MIAQAQVWDHKRRKALSLSLRGSRAKVRAPFSPPKPVSLRDAGFATSEVALGCGFSSARVCVAL